MAARAGGSGNGEKGPPEAWSTEEVRQWITGLGLRAGGEARAKAFESYGALFVKEDYTGAELKILAGQNHEGRAAALQQASSVAVLMPC
jgi:hypothetical protein